MTTTSKHWHKCTCEICQPLPTLETLAAENQRLREALEAYAECGDGCTCGDGWSHDLAREALKPSPAPQPDTQDPLENWICHMCGWKGLELTYLEVEPAHKRYHSKQGTKCGNIKMYLLNPPVIGGESSAPVVKESLSSEAILHKHENIFLKSQISTLTAERDALRSRAEWVKCSDRMPGRDEPVILFIPNLQPPIAGELYFYENSRWETAVKGEPIWECLTPTHWMTLPPPPNDGQATVAETGSLLPTPLDPAPTTGKEDVK